MNRIQIPNAEKITQQHTDKERPDKGRQRERGTFEKVVKRLTRSNAVRSARVSPMPN